MRMVEEIEGEMSADGFWDNRDAALSRMNRLKSLKMVVSPLKEIIGDAEELATLIELVEEDSSADEEIRREIENLESRLDDLELKALLNGPHDDHDAILSIYARDGGTDANDWAEMMLRMYINWANSNDYQIELLDRSDNEDAGINNASIVVRGPLAYGYLKGETGMHRLVRISPFNADGKRQTSFAAVDVSPEVPEAEEIKIDDKDVREDTYRAQGAGGQHVNKTDSAVRLTHLPTGIVAQCQQERSQHKNRAQAWKMLQSKLAQLEEDKRIAEEESKYQSKARTGFGSQIRNYFLHPDQRVKDARTGFSMGDFHKVLDGDLQGFLDAYLNWLAKESRNEVDTGTTGS